METILSAQATRLLDSAEAHLARGGYNGFSYADLSAEIGITKASIHHHFAKKSDLVRVLVARYRGAAAAGMATLDAQVADPLERLRAYAAWWSACIADGRMPICVCALLGAEMPALPAEVGDEVRAHFVHLAGWLERVLAEGAASGRFALRDSPAHHAQALMATVHGAMLSARTCGDATLFERIVAPTFARLGADP